MHLFRTDALFRKIHRSGWPYAWEALNAVQSRTGLRLDDFVEATFRYQHHPPHQEPWVGIFHHPVNIKSLIKEDEQMHLKYLDDRKGWRQNLVGAIALCPQVAEYLETWLKVPVTFIPHPSETNVPQWQNQQYTMHLWQVGYFLRNTMFIESINPKLTRTRSGPTLPWHVNRDRRLAKMVKRIPGTQLIPRLSASEYDERMASTIVCMELFGSSANNVIVECCARNTPILVNRTLETEYYLGVDYPLFFENHSHAIDLLHTPNIFRRTHEYLAARDHEWLSGEYFAEHVNSFVESL